MIILLTAPNFSRVMSSSSSSSCHDGHVTTHSIRSVALSLVIYITLVKYGRYVSGNKLTYNLSIITTVSTLLRYASHNHTISSTHSIPICYDNCTCMLQYVKLFTVTDCFPTFPSAHRCIQCALCPLKKPYLYILNQVYNT